MNDVTKSVHLLLFVDLEAGETVRWRIVAESVARADELDVRLILCRDIQARRANCQDLVM